MISSEDKTVFNIKGYWPKVIQYKILSLPRYQIDLLWRQIWNRRNLRCFQWVASHTPSLTFFAHRPGNMIQFNALSNFAKSYVQILILTYNS